MTAAKTRSQIESALIKIDPNHFGKDRIHAEAEYRASFVRGIGSPMCGYADGYMDGFEHAVDWLISQSADPFLLHYRHDAGMDFAKRSYATRPKERKRLLETFEKRRNANAKSIHFPNTTPPQEQCK